MFNQENCISSAISAERIDENTFFNGKTVNSNVRNPLENNLDYTIIELDDGIKPLILDGGFSNFIEENAYDLIILVTAYNEGAKEFFNTIENGIEKNIKDLYDSSCKNIGVIVIADGLKPFYEAAKSHQNSEAGKNNDSKIIKRCENIFCGKMTNEPECNYFNQFVMWESIQKSMNYVYGQEHPLANREDPEILVDLSHNKNDPRKEYLNKQFQNKEKEKAHLFCQKVKLPGEISYTLMFCIKQENKRKLNTHSWFLKGFCKSLNPEFIIFLDVGTRPLEKSLSSLYTCLKTDPSVAGCCGEILPDTGKCCNFLEQAQIIEYKFSHIFDKSFESLFGYISVLPGAFSAYRYKCFTEEILNVYFFTENNKKIGLFEANMFLAEDRILCLEMVCMIDEKYLLRYVPGSKAETDVPDQLHVLLNQRRRWNNGAWFSSIYTIRNWSKIMKSAHSFKRKVCLSLLMGYFVITTLFTWVLVGAFYVSFSISLKRNMQETNNDLNKLNKFSTPVIMFYVSTLIATVIVSLSVKPEKIKHFLNTLSAIFGFYTILTIFLAIRFIFRDGLEFSYNIKENISIILLGLTILVSILAILLKYTKDIPAVIKGLFPFFFMSGTYVNMFLIYSICNIHDVSWGNRPGGESVSEQQKAHFESQRITWLLIWVLSNGLFSSFFNWLSGGEDENARKFILYFAWITFGVIFVKILGGLVYIFYTCCCMKTRNT